MAEAVIVVCDDCGKPADQTVAFRVGGRSFQKDLQDAPRTARQERANAKAGTPKARCCFQAGQDPPQNRLLNC